MGLRNVRFLLVVLIMCNPSKKVGLTLLIKLLR